MASNRGYGPTRFPLAEQDRFAIEDIVHLIRSHLSSMNPRELRSAAVVLLALDRMPYATPGVHVSFGFSTPRQDGNWGWADVEIIGDEFRLGVGEHFYDPDVGGDTQSRTVFQMQAGTRWREGEIDEWLQYAQAIADDGRPMLEDYSDDEAIDWVADERVDDWDET